LSECFQEFDSAKHLSPDADAIDLAIWFHDAIYDTHRADNEEVSAHLAKDWLTDARARDAVRERVVSFVLASKHAAAPEEANAKLFADVDLSILGQTEERFAEYERQIRLEYDWVPEQIFAAKRAKILEQFLARPTIFSTDNFRTRYEAQARRNLEASIRHLR
jgi:predicted metal-dependent HD superfamily phosphohydrolase